jgi:hypothetical protein
MLWPSEPRISNPDLDQGSQRTNAKGIHMKIKEIEQAMTNNIVWCVNKYITRHKTSCAKVSCGFKDCKQRLATARELYRCRVFEITTPNKVRVLP